MFGPQSNGVKAICQFHLRGQCKYGSQCWNSHQERGNNTLFGGSATTSGLYTGFDKNSSSVQDKPFLEFIKQVGVEMNSWEKNGMWLLSSLSPLKDHPALAGFSDTSPEELRVEAYDALKKNNPNLYQNRVKEKLEFHKNLRQSLRNQTPEAIAALRAVFYKNGDTTTASSVNAFGKTSSTSVTSLFGKSASDQPSLFGGTAINQTASLFGNAGNSASTNQSASIFGGPGNSSSNQPTNLFGASNSSLGHNQASIFAGSSSSNVSNQSTNLFGGIPNSSGSIQASNLFGVSGNSSGTNQAASLFGGSGNPAASTNIFGTKPQNSTFGAAPIFSSLNSNGTSTFNVPSGVGVFGGPSNSLFGSNSSAVQGSSLFGNHPQSNSTNSNLFNNPQSVFGGSNQSPIKSSLFGSQNQGATSLFGNLGSTQLTSTGTVFGNSAVPQGTQSFIGAVDLTQNTLFSSSQPNSATNLVCQDNQAALFGRNSNQVASSIFGNNNKSNQATANFSSNNSSIFGEQVNQNCLLDTNQRHDTSSNSTTNHVGLLNSGTLFGKNFASTQSGNTFLGTTPSIIQQPVPVATNNTNLFGSGNTSFHNNNYSSSGSKVYTPLHLLSDEDRKEFERDIFLKIPLVPPPKELCIGL